VQGNKYVVSMFAFQMKNLSILKLSKTKKKPQAKTKNKHTPRKVT